MTVFKCKMCGGTIDFQPGDTVGVCEYCGTKQTLPKIDDERKANLYDRANHFRRANDFDKAMAIYEQILDEDTTDAEAYWSLVLCRYGIEYVEDPTTHKRVPTVNRVQYTSIFADEDYKAALSHADTYQQVIYEEEAKAIDEIQKGILAISEKEEPFDIFICYKETDNNGRRTEDSVLAYDIYKELTKEGYKVFFSRVTLEDKLGTAYEPYIFAALNSSKIMIAVGTKAEFYNAVWVKNEWSRYLALIKKGAKKTLIPAYKGMDPYDLPEEFSHLQGQDMAKLGFMQDLVRGVKKILGESETRTIANTKTVPLLEKANEYLEAKDWKNAKEYFERVLDLDPTNMKANLGMLLTDQKVTKEEELLTLSTPLDTTDSYTRAIRYADEDLSNRLKGYNEEILKRNAEKKKKSIKIGVFCSLAVIVVVTLFFLTKNVIIPAAKYARANQLLNNEQFDEAIKIYESLGTYKDSTGKIGICRAKKSYVLAYNSGMQFFEEGNYIQAKNQFKMTNGYKDSAERIEQCDNAILEPVRQAVLASIEDGDYASAYDLLDQYTNPTGSNFINAAVELKKELKYEEALLKMESGDYSEAYENLQYLANHGEYKDSAEKREECANYIEKQNQDAIEEAQKTIQDSLTKAQQNLNNGNNVIDALKVLYSLEGEFDVESIILEFEQSMLSKANVGDIVILGHMEQDKDTSNGDEPIEWIVLEKEGSKLLLLSKYVLANAYYNITSSSYWKSSELRKTLLEWKEKCFYSSEAENFLVQTSLFEPVSESAIKYQVCEDYMFLLNLEEIEKYFPTDEERIAASASKPEGGGSVYWLLPDKSVLTPQSVGPKGTILNGTGTANQRGVRPAMWVDYN